MMNSRDSIRRVLVVDDERVISESLSLILSKSGFACKAAYSGEHAIDVARTFLPDLIISDILMTGMTGIEAAITVRDFLPDCRVILFSGQATTVNLLGQHSGNGYQFEILAKPLAPQVLLERIAQLS
jgi:CheY-like chemotaxis protein